MCVFTRSHRSWTFFLQHETREHNIARDNFLLLFFPFFLKFYHSNRFVFRSWWIYVNMNCTYDLHSFWDRAERDVVVPMQLWHRLWVVSTCVAPTFCNLKPRNRIIERENLLFPRENRNYVRYTLEVSLENDFTWWILRERHVSIRFKRTQCSILNSHSVQHYKKSQFNYFRTYFRIHCMINIIIVVAFSFYLHSIESIKCKMYLLTTAIIAYFISLFLYCGRINSLFNHLPTLFFELLIAIFSNHENNIDELSLCIFRNEF